MINSETLKWSNKYTQNNVIGQKNKNIFWKISEYQNFKNIKLFDHTNEIIAKTSMKLANLVIKKQLIQQTDDPETIIFCKIFSIKRHKKSR